MVNLSKNTPSMNDEDETIEMERGYALTEQDLRQIQGHERRKKRNSVIQAITLVVLLGLVLYVVLDKREPDPLLPPPEQWTQRDGFVAISYGGLSRSEKRGTRSVSRQLFKKHMVALQDAGYRIVTTKDIVDYYWNDKPLPDRALYLMFEGGRKDSAIFAQRVLRDLNLRATMYIQTARLTRGNRFFIQATELGVLAKSPYWEVGSQGYELRHINVMPDEGYRFFLTDYLRDAYRNPTETDEEIQKRIEEDYELAYSPIEKFTEEKPEAYIFMPANTLWRSLEERVEAVNARMLDRYYKIVFAREGPSYNTKQTAPFNLTRMQVFPDWSVNRLLMEIETASPHRHVYEQANEDVRNLWRADSGAMSSSEESIVLTAQKDEPALAWLRGSDAWDNVDASLVFSGSARGDQKLYLRHSSNQSNLCVTLNRNRMTITESVPRRGTNTLFETHLDYGLNPEKLRFTLIGNRLTVRVGDSEEPVTTEPVPIARAVQRGRIALGAFGEDEPYDAIFDNLSFYPLPHRWVGPDPAAEAEHPPKETREEMRTCTIIPLGEKSEQWDEYGSRTLYRALDKGQAIFGQLPEGAITLEALDRPWSTIEAGMLPRFLTGVILTPGDNPDWKSVAQVAAKAKERGLDVAIRLSRSAASRLAASEIRPEAGWILYDFRDALPAEVDTALKQHYDRRFFLSIPQSNPGVPEIYTWAGEDAR